MRKVLLLLCSVTLVLGAGACSGSDAGGPSEPGGPTSTTGATTAGSGGAGDPAAYVEALATGLRSGAGPLPVAASEATCIATAWVDVIGDRLAATGVAPEELAAFDSSRLGLTAAQGEAMMAAYSACGVDVEDQFTTAISASTTLTDDQKACVSDQLGALDLEAVLAAVLVDPVRAEADHRAELDAIGPACGLDLGTGSSAGAEPPG